jgi:hypothetical protein
MKARLSSQFRAGLLLIAILIVPGVVHAQTIEVTNSDELAAAVVPANAGMTIHVQSSCAPCIVKNTLVVPDGASIVGDGVMTGEGRDMAFVEGTYPTLQADPSLTGNMLVLDDGNALSGFRLQDVQAQNSDGTFSPRRGNVIAVYARQAGDSISVNLTDMDIGQPNIQQVTPQGPLGTGVIFLVPSTCGNSVLNGQLSHSILRTTQYPGGARPEALFAISYASGTQIDLSVSHNFFTGGGVAYSLHAGVPHPFPLTGSSLVVDSNANTFVFDGPMPDPVEAWGISAGSSVPAPIRFGASSVGNYFSLVSTDDVIEGYGTGIRAIAGWRSFGFQAVQPVPSGTWAGISGISDNTAELTLRAMKVHATVVDLLFSAGEADCPNFLDPVCFSPGDNNILRATLQGVKDGKSSPSTDYTNVFNNDGEASGSLAGMGNQLEVVHKGL